MWASMSRSTSLSSSIFGLANTANPTLRSASTQGRTTSALPGAILVKTVASGSTTTPGRSALTSAVRASSQRPSASKRGRSVAVGRRPRIEPRPMSRLGASHTSRTRPVVDAKLFRLSPIWGPIGGAAWGWDEAAGVAASSVRLIFTVAPRSARRRRCPLLELSSRTWWLGERPRSVGIRCRGRCG